jgi:hypothetical protein
MKKYLSRKTIILFISILIGLFIGFNFTFVKWCLLGYNQNGMESHYLYENGYINDWQVLIIYKITNDLEGKVCVLSLLPQEKVWENINDIKILIKKKFENFNTLSREDKIKLCKHFNWLTSLQEIEFELQNNQYDSCLEKLSNDSDWGIRRHAAFSMLNLKTQNTKVFRKLLMDSQPDVVNTAIYGFSDTIYHYGFSKEIESFLHKENYQDKINRIREPIKKSYKVWFKNYNQAIKQMGEPANVE